MSSTKQNNKKLFSSAVLFTSGQLLIRCLSLISTPILTALMSQADYGVTSTFITWYVILSAIFSLYTQSSIAMGSIDYDDLHYRQYLSSVITLSTCSFAIGSIIFYFLRSSIERISGFPSMWLPFLVIISYAYYLLNFYQTVLIYDGKQKKYLFISLFISLTGLILSIILVKNLENRALGRIIGLTAPMIIIAVIAFVKLFHISSTFNKNYWKYSLRLSLPMVINYLSIYLIAQISILFLKYYKGFNAVGVYSASYTLAETVSYFSTGIHQAWAPWYFNKLKINDIIDIQQALSIFTKIVGCIFCGFILVIPEIAKLLINQNFWDGLIIIPIVVTGLFFKFINNFYVSHFIYMKKNIMISILTFISLILQVVASIFLIPRYNLIGAALGGLISNFSLLIIYQLVIKVKNEQIPFHSLFYWQSVLLLILTNIIFYVCFNQWIIRWVLGALIGIYLIIYFIKNKTMLKGLMKN